MANRIAGITVEIGGDVGPLSRALESCNRTIKTTATQLKDVERLLKLDPTNTELLPWCKAGGLALSGAKWCRRLSRISAQGLCRRTVEYRPGKRGI